MVESGRVGSKMVKLRVDVRVHTKIFQFFNGPIHLPLTDGPSVKCKEVRLEIYSGS